MKESNVPLLVAKDNYLYVRDPWQCMYTEPKRYRNYWPTGVRLSIFNQDIVGQELQQISLGVYQTMSEFPIRVELKNLEKTLSEYCDVEDVKKPKNATIWRNGNWLTPRKK